MKENRYELNKNLAQMLKGGVIMDVTTPEQAKIAEAAGACAVMALERIPFRRSRSTTLTRARSSPPPTTFIISIKRSLTYRSCAVRRTSARHCAASARARR